MEFRSIELRLTLDNPAFDVEKLATLLIDDSDQARAFGVLWQGHSLGTLISPDVHGQAEPILLDWAESLVDRTDSGSSTPMRVLARADDLVLTSLLRERGYAVAGEELRMGRHLADPIPEPVLPPSFIIRPLSGSGELDEWLRLYAHAFGERPAALRRWRAIRSDPDHEPARDLVAIAPSGELAALCYCSIASLEAAHGSVRIGRTEPVATLEKYRRLGLARALVNTGLRLLAEHGMDVAALTMETDNAAALQLYTSLAYRPLNTASWFVRPSQ